MKRLTMLCILGWIGCGGGAATPVQRCDDLVNDICDRAVQCAPQQGTHADCVQAVQQIVACGMAKKIGTSYDRCVQQIKADSCQILFPTNPNTGQMALSLPADCNGVIQSFEPGAPIASSPFHAANALSTVSPD